LGMLGTFLGGASHKRTHQKQVGDTCFFFFPVLVGSPPSPHVHPQVASRGIPGNTNKTSRLRQDVTPSENRPLVLILVHEAWFAFFMAKILHNYLRTYRKRAALSQDEVAFLLGYQHGTKVSRYERNARQPGLETALAYEALFGAPVRELFAGHFKKVQGITMQRARVLARKLSAATRSPLTARKLELLRTIISSGSVLEPADEV
jgi:DNA-binding XRE family transcriptional regulator